MSALQLEPRAAALALAGSGADAPDGPIREAVRLADAGDLATAAERSARLIHSGVTDARALAYFLFGVFLEQGIGAVPTILETLGALFGARWDAARPLERRVTVVSGATRWLLRTMVQHIDFHQRMDDETFRAWRALDAATVGQPALASAVTLRVSMLERLGPSPAGDLLSELEARLRTSFNRSPARKAAPALVVVPPPPPPTPPPPDEEPVVSEEDEPFEAAADAPVVEKVSPPPADATGMELSPAFVAFRRKLAAFATLIERGDIGRASIVAADVQRILTDFDPKTYFPKTLTPFFILYSGHAELISQQGDLDPATAAALEQLYTVDLDAFLDA